MPRARVCCSSCEKMLVPGPGSLAQPTCQECRRKARERTCESCGEKFVARGRDRPENPNRFCSVKCRVAARTMYEHPRAASKASTRARKAQRRLTWDGVTDQQIFERDGWVCRIPGCGRPIQPELRHPDPGSASIDHIVPLSRGGDDTAANKRAAHLVCNTRRGARDIAVVPVIQVRQKPAAPRQPPPVRATPILVTTGPVRPMPLAWKSAGPRRTPDPKNPLWWTSVRPT